jgi:hypothetical protein
VLLFPKVQHHSTDDGGIHGWFESVNLGHGVLHILALTAALLFHLWGILVSFGRMINTCSRRSGNNN